MTKPKPKRIRTDHLNREAHVRWVGLLVRGMRPDPASVAWPSAATAGISGTTGSLETWPEYRLWRVVHECLGTTFQSSP